MYKATKGLGTDESALRFVLCSKASFNKRETCQTIDKNKISNDIDLLSEVSCLKTDQIIEIFCKNSFDYIQCLCRMYEHKTEKNLGTFLSEHFSTDFGQFSIDPIKFYSGKLKEGIDCKDVYKIIRVIVTRCEVTRFFNIF
ncbi:hypothetical protein HZS_1547 [Henneguya salminicola]|nr:hypothetical protein HZS_1547 [Henneguya salminicola]